MAKQTVTIRSRRQKTGSNSGYQKRNICHGTGRVKKSKK